MEFQELTNKVIGAAFTVYNRMGFGFLESVYEKFLLLELQKAGILAENQAEILVKYDDKVVGEFKADLLVENEVIIELKSIKTIMQIHEVQLVNYLKATGKDLGLLINFGEKGVQVKRKIRNLEKISREDSDNSVDPVILSKENPVDPV